MLGRLWIELDVDGMEEIEFTQHVNKVV